MSDNDGVHARHCCSRHGCKYGDMKWDSEVEDWVPSDCPVANDCIKQEGPCQYCIDPVEARQDIKVILEEIEFVEGLYKTKETG